MVPVPLRYLLEGHAQLCSDGNFLGVIPVRVLFEQLLQFLDLVFVLFVPFAVFEIGEILSLQLDPR